MAKKFSETAVGQTLTSVPVLGKAAGAIIDGIGSVFGAKAEAKQQRKTMEYQYELNQKSADAQLERDKQFFDHQNAANQENWEAQNEYNSPENQRRRLEEAGMHASAAGGSGLSSSMSTIDSAHGGAGAGLGVSALSSMGPVSAAGTIAGAFKDLGQSALSTAQYNKEIASTNLLDQQFISERLRQGVIKADERLKLAQGDSEQFLAKINEVEAGQRESMLELKMDEISAGIRQMDTSIMGIVAAAYRDFKAGDLSVAEKNVAIEQAKKYQTAQALDVANTVLSYAMAGLHAEETELVQLKQTWQKYQNALSALDLFKGVLTLDSDVREAAANAGIAEANEIIRSTEADFVEDKIESEIRNTNMKTITGYLDLIFRGFDAYIDYQSTETRDDREKAERKKSFDKVRDTFNSLMSSVLMAIIFKKI